LGEVIKDLRRSHGLTQAELADLLTFWGAEMRTNTVTKLELGNRPTTIAELEALSNVLNIHPVALIEMVFPRNRNKVDIAALRAELDATNLELRKYQERIATNQAELAEDQQRANKLMSHLAALTVKLQDASEEKS
ncbi:helix-turn-helix domain-containing protein, partial [Glutamicibacter arilaitensis]